MLGRLPLEVITRASLDSLEAESNGALRVVGRAGESIPPLEHGDLIVGLAPGEGALAEVATLEDARLWTRDEAAASGWLGPGTRDGLYARVALTDRTGASQVRLRRIAGRDARLAPGQWLVRPTDAAPAPASVPMPVPMPVLAGLDGDDDYDAPPTEDLEDLRRELQAALRAGSGGLSRVAELGRRAVRGGATVVAEVLRTNVTGAVRLLVDDGAQQLAQGFETVLTAGSGVLAGLLHQAPLGELGAMARGLLDAARQANQRGSGVVTAWVRAIPDANRAIAAGTAALGSVLTSLLARVPMEAFFPGRLGELPFAALTRAFRRSLREATIPFELPVDPARLLRLLGELVRYAGTDAAAEATLLRMIGDQPHLAPFVLAAAVVEALAAGRVPWLRYVGKDLAAEEDRRALEASVQWLPAPGSTRTVEGTPPYRVKYLIVSDCHRGAEGDAGFSAGSLQHFDDNKALYGAILDWVLAGEEGDQTRHILVENGDAEEFWEVPDLTQDPAARMTEVLQHNQEIYARLKRLHAQGRYFRTQGNHDGPLRDPRVLRVLQEWDGGWTGPSALVVPDFAIIPGVKTMDEFTLLDLLSGERAPADFIGLDPAVYTHKKCMVVCHGHQFDFWNCKDNELLGKIVTASVRWPDGWMDRVVPLGGVHMQGNPLFEFGEAFAHDRNFLFNHWPLRQPSIVKAHRVQHMKNDERQLQDGWLYQETIASVLVSLLMPLGSCGEGQPAPASLRDRLGHHLLIGHTHYPQSQPYYPLGRLLLGSAEGRARVDALARGVGQMLAASLGPGLPSASSLEGFSVAETLRRWLDGSFKARFFNSGVTGWHQGVIYGIEIDAEGQARLVYWTAQHLVRVGSGSSAALRVGPPSTMDWELAPLTAAQRQALARARARLARTGQAVIQAARERVGRTVEALREQLGVFRNGLESLVDAVAQGVGVRTSVVGSGPAALSDELGVTRLQLGLVEFMTQLGAWLGAGGAAAGESDALGETAAPLPAAAFTLTLSRERRARLEQVAGQLSAAGLVPSPGQAHHLAMAWLYAFEHVPLVGNAHEGSAQCRAPGPGSALSPSDRALLSLGSVATWLPPSARVARGNLETVMQLRPAALDVQLRVTPSVAATPLARAAASSPTTRRG
ncbi:MAG: hypothetical protein KDK70_03440 [Myxococcales bacterium]|nr:hypothetical protein [Myxococcales bacterium]